MTSISACLKTKSNGKKHVCLPQSLRTRLPRWLSLDWRSPEVQSGNANTIRISGKEVKVFSRSKTAQQDRFQISPTTTLSGRFGHL